MVGQDNPYQVKPVPQLAERVGPKYPWMRQGWFRLLALLFILEALTPFLQWPIGLPRAITAGMEAAAALLVLFAFAFMLKEDKIPKIVPLILGITLIWGIVSVFEGQSPAALAWGWWRMFKYPLVGLFTYLYIDSPKDFARWFIRFCVMLLIFQVGVQLVMYAMGYPINDDLAGTFGRKGVMQFTMMLFFVVSIGMGYWLATQKWKLLLFLLTVGLVGSTLNATKFYLLGIVVLLAATLLIHLIRGSQIRQLVVFAVLLAMAAAIAVPLYNNFLVNQQGLPPLQDYLKPEVMERYLFVEAEVADTGTYYFGRGMAISYAWQQIQRDATTTLFGFGLGSRSSSTVLGVAGASLQSDLYGGVSTTTLSTWIQEYGLVGTLLFQAIAIWIVIQLFRFVRRTSDPYQAALAYGLILFTLFWPLWFWYHKAWLAGVMLILYWVSLAYLFRQMHLQPRRAPDRAGPR
jgi:hypothetical protein